MYEIEIKAYCDDPADLKKRAAAAGAVFIAKRMEQDLYFNHPVRDFGVTDEALRIRNAGGKSMITYKGPKLSNKTKTRYEKEVSVEDGSAIGEILKKLGFIEVETVTKMRELYRLKDIEICFDAVEGLGNFVELEIQGENQKQGEERILSVARSLGIERFERRSYLELKLAGRKSTG